MSAPLPFQKPPPPPAPVTPTSNALFRLGERCNHRCPMCSNTGKPELWSLAVPEALARADHLASLGFRRVVLTGGEPTIYPGFWEVVARLQSRGLAWDVNTHGETFSAKGFAARAISEGLKRAIVSLHGHEEPTSRVMSGLMEGGHRRILAGIDALLEAGAELMLNLVLSRYNLPELAGYVGWAAGRWGDRVTLKVCFPNLVGKGGTWEGIQLRYEVVVEPVRAALALARQLKVPLELESMPSCVHGEPDRANLGRTGFGETHYLDDRDGRTLYDMALIEAMIGFYSEDCRACAAFARCPGVPSGYVRRFGLPTLRPFPS